MNFEKSALLVIDMQNDFMEGGSLEVAEANSLITPINELMKLDWKVVVASKDWHPADHVSFVTNHEGATAFEEITLEDGSKQMMWPEHCIQNSFGSEVHKDIEASSFDEIVFKGQNSNVDSYSAFFDNNHLEQTTMDGILKENGITDIYVVGLARDYCTRFTATDGQGLDYKTYFVYDATKAVDDNSNTLVLEELEKANVSVINIADII